MQNGLNENIKKLRLARGLNQVEFAKAVSVTKQCVSNWENDNVLPSIEMLVRIADFFSVTTDFLLGRATDTKIDAEGLTEEQLAHIRLLIEDFKKANN
jgi:transcriptional regulator with XRE-family HTH domain